MAKGLVIIPTYNEIDNITDIIHKSLCQHTDFEVLIVDDNSPDGTGDIVKTLKSTNHRIHLIQRSGKLGLGTAYIAGFKYGLDNDFEYIFEMDADFSHNPSDLIRLYEAAVQGADVVIGSRYIKGGNIKNWSKDRILLSYCASIYVRIVIWMPIKDPTAGFICYKAIVLKSIDLDKIKFVGYSFQIEMKYSAWIKKFKLKEIPITFIDRVKGNSKMSGNIISEAVKGVIMMRIRSLTGHYK